MLQINPPILITQRYSLRRALHKSLQRPVEHSGSKKTIVMFVINEKHQIIRSYVFLPVCYKYAYFLVV